MKKTKGKGEEECGAKRPVTVKFCYAKPILKHGRNRKGCTSVFHAPVRIPDVSQYAWENRNSCNRTGLQRYQLLLIQTNKRTQVTLLFWNPVQLNCQHAQEVVASGLFIITLSWESKTHQEMGLTMFASRVNSSECFTEVATPYSPTHRHTSYWESHSSS